MSEELAACGHVKSELSMPCTFGYQCPSVTAPSVQSPETADPLTIEEAVAILAGDATPEIDELPPDPITDKQILDALYLRANAMETAYLAVTKAIALLEEAL